MERLLRKRSTGDSTVLFTIVILQIWSLWAASRAARAAVNDCHSSAEEAHLGIVERCPFIFVSIYVSDAHETEVCIRRQGAGHMRQVFQQGHEPGAVALRSERPD